MTKDTENVNKKWDTEILSMTKAYEKDVFLKLRRSNTYAFIPAVNDTNKNLEGTSNKTCPSKEKARNVETGYQKIDKIQKGTT